MLDEDSIWLDDLTKTAEQMGGNGHYVVYVSACSNGATTFDPVNCQMPPIELEFDYPFLSGPRPKTNQCELTLSPNCAGHKVSKNTKCSLTAVLRDSGNAPLPNVKFSILKTNAKGWTSWKNGKTSRKSTKKFTFKSKKSASYQLKANSLGCMSPVISIDIDHHSSRK